jgi:hypothetical protein
MSAPPWPVEFSGTDMSASSSMYLMTSASTGSCGGGGDW